MSGTLVPAALEHDSWISAGLANNNVDIKVLKVDLKKDKSRIVFVSEEDYYILTRTIADQHGKMQQLEEKEDDLNDELQRLKVISDENKVTREKIKELDRLRDALIRKRNLLLMKADAEWVDSNLPRLRTLAHRRVQDMVVGGVKSSEV